MNKTVSSYLFFVFLSTFFIACSAPYQSNNIQVSNFKSVYTSSGKFTYHLHNREKNPTIIMESNVGDGLTIWNQAVNNLTINNNVLLYNRAGYDLSISNATTRSVEIVVNELKQILEELGLKPPYIFVSHSFGSLYVEYFAKKYPFDLSGVVFIDPWLSNLNRICKNNGLHSCKPSTISSYLYQELDYINHNTNQLKTMKPYTNIPTVIISSYNKSKQNSNFMDVWLESHYEFLDDIDNAKHIICKNCGHYIHLENPQIINESLLWILEQ